MPSITISVINYRTGDLTIACIESVLADLDRLPEGDRPAVKIVVIDNASRDGSAEQIAAWIAAHPQAPVRLIQSEVNSGFAGGHNRVIGETCSDYVFLLNSDAELRPGCLAELLGVAEANSHVGIVSPRIEDPSGERQNSCFRFPSLGSELIRGAKSAPVTRMLSRWYLHLGETPEKGRIDWCEFSCVLLRRKMIDQLGPMDEGFFLYFEDVEYCRRAGHVGWQIRHVPAARVMHHIGGSGEEKGRVTFRSKRPKYYYASRSRYFYLAGGYFGLWSANAGWLCGRVIANLRRVVGKPVSAVAEREYREIWINAMNPMGPSHAPVEAA